MDMDGDADGGSDHDNNTSQSRGVQDMAKRLVRLALACEYQRKPLRRTDIVDKVLGANGRQFKTVFSEAQVQLEAVFGMQMVEMPAKDKVTLQQKRAARRATSQTKVPVTSWLLVSTLPTEFKRPDIIQPPAIPTKAEDATYTATYTLLVALIALSGGSLPDAKMERYLRKLQLDHKTPVSGYEKTELLLKRMERDGYIVKIKESTGMGEDDLYWLVGPRGKVEVGTDGVTGLAKAVYGDQVDDAAEDELDRRIARSLAMNEDATQGQESTQQVERPRKRAKNRPSAEQEQDQEDEDEDDDAD